MADIKECRRKIDKIDSEISRLLDARRDILEAVAHYKKKNNIMLFQENYKAVHEIRLLSAVAVPDEKNIIER